MAVAKKLNSKYRGLLGVLWIFVLFITGWTMYAALPAGGLSALQYAANPYALLHLVAIVTSIYIFRVIRQPRLRGPVTTWFSILSIFMILTIVMNFFQRISATSATFQYWHTLTIFPTLMMTVLTLVFVVHYVQREKVFENPFFWVAVFMLVGVTLQADLGTPIHVIQSRAGFVSDNNFDNLAEILTGLAASLIAVFLLVRYARAQRDKKRSTQSLIILSAILGGVVFVVLLSVILQPFGIPQGVYLGVTPVVGNVLIGYSISKYGLASLDPRTINQTIVSSIKEAILVVDNDGVITFTNHEAHLIFEKEQDDLLYSNIKEYFEAAARRNIQLLFARLSEDEDKASSLTQVKLKSGRDVSLKVAKIVRESSIQGFIWVLSDLTELHRTLEQLQHQTWTLQVAKESEEEARAKAEKLLANAERLEDDLRAERDQATAVISSMAEGLVVMNHDLEVVLINEAGAKLVGQKIADIIGHKWSSICDVMASEDLLKLEQRPIYRVMTTGEVVSIRLEDNYEIQPSKTGAKVFPVAIKLAPLKRDGKVIGVVFIFRDIADERHAIATIEERVELRTHELQAARTRMLASVNSLKQGFIMTDEKDEILSINFAAAQLFCPHHGADEKHTPTCTVADIAKALGDELDIKSKISATFNKGKSAEYKNINYNNRVLDIYISPIIMDKKAIGATILVADETESMIVERSKDEFFSIASHELRTPLTAIKGNTSLMMEYYADSLKEPDLKEMIEDIHTSSVRLIEIVNDFLDTSRIEQGKIRLEKEDFLLDEVIESVVNDMDTTAQQKAVKIIVENKAVDRNHLVHADKNRTRQIVYNLIGNALKFTENGTIKIKASREGKSLIKITVADNGQGISGENQQLLFHKFQQATDNLLTRDTTKGTGLGLYISKLLVEHMGGNIALESSAVGKGSSFSFTLPIAKTTAKK